VPRKLTTRALAFASSLALLAAFVWAVAARPLSHDDLFWHLRTGELIAQTGSVPHADPFSHTMPGAAWTTHEWGFALLVYGVHQLGGLAALVHLVQLLGVLLFAAIFAAMRRAVTPARTALLVPLLLLGLAAAQRPCFILRAALLSTLCLALLCDLLQRLHVENRRRENIAIAALFLLWANLHVGVVFGLVVLALFFVQAAVVAWQSAPTRGWSAVLRGTARARALLVVCCAALTLLNANGLELWKFPFKLNAILYHSGITWDMGHYQPPTLAQYPAFYLLVALCLAACLPLSRLWSAIHAGAQPVLGLALCTFFFLAMSLRSGRFVPDFVVFALPFCACMWGGALLSQHAPSADPSAVRSVRLHALAGSAWPHVGYALLLALALVYLAPPFPRSLVDPRFPRRAVDFMQREAIQGRMFNYENAGGYIGWRLRTRVYWDGRNDVFGPLAKELAYTDDFGVLVQRHGLDILALDRAYYPRLRAYLARARRDWGLVYFDDVIALYLKRVPKFQSVLRRDQYELLQPFGVPSEADVDRLMTDPALRARLETEVTRLSRQNDASFAGWYLRGLVAGASGDQESAYRAFKRAAAISEQADVLYALGRTARALGRDGEARAWVSRALALVGH
jgi:hypothetical protein